MLKEKSLANSQTLEVGRNIMTTKTQSPTSKASKGPVNSVALELVNKELVVVAKHGKNEDEKSLLVLASGGISQKATIRGLRLIIAYLESKGLPTEPVEDLVLL